MTDESADLPNKRVMPPEGADEALQRVIASDAFAGAQRLKAFLAYVVEETLSGRGEAIRGKTIAEDVYGRAPTEDGDPQSVVRVDAGRLRRRLSDYYAGTGRNDPLRIHIDSGGYAPRFEVIDRSAYPTRPVTPAQRQANHLTVAAVGILVAVAITAVFVLLFSPDNTVTIEQPVNPSDIAKRQAVLEKSGSALQAVNLAEQARGLIFPMFNVERLKLTTEMFRQAIALDDHYAGGYAGAAQTLAGLSLMAREPARRRAFLAEAQELAGRAQAMDPTNAWVLSAAAWVAFVAREYDRAERLSRHALTLAPEDGNVLDFFAIIALFSGRFEEARNAAAPKRRRTGPNLRFANQNIYAAANFHLGNYTLTIDALQTGAETGGPFSPPVLAFLAAAYHASDNVRMAGSMVKALEKSWPDMPVDTILRRFYRDPKDADAVLRPLFSAGWRSPAG